MIPRYFILSILVLIAVAGCSGPAEQADTMDLNEKYDAEIRQLLLGDQAELGKKDFAEIQARAEATKNGVLDEVEYERLLEIKRATVPNMRVEYTIIEASYYESGGMTHANILAEKRIIVDGSRLSEEGWKNVRSTYDHGEGSSGTYIDDENQQVIMSNLENFTAAIQNGTWTLNPVRIVE